GHAFRPSLGPRSSSDAEGIRFAGLPGAASRQGSDSSNSAGRYLGSEQHRTTGISARVCGTTAKENRGRLLVSQILADRTVGGISVRAFALNSLLVVPCFTRCISFFACAGHCFPDIAAGRFQPITRRNG